MKNIKKTLLLLVLSTTLALGGQSLAFAAEAVPVAEQQAAEVSEEEAVEIFVTDFLQQHTQATLDNAIAMMKDQGITHLYKFVHQILFANGLERLDNISVSVFPIEENTWIAAVNYDMIIDGIDNGVTSGLAVLVNRQADKSMYIDIGSGYYNTDYYNKVLEYINSSDEINAIIDQANTVFNIQEMADPNITEWLDKLVDYIIDISEQIAYDEELYEYLFYDAEF